MVRFNLGILRALPPELWNEPQQEQQSLREGTIYEYDSTRDDHPHISIDRCIAVSPTGLSHSVVSSHCLSISWTRLATNVGIFALFNSRDIVHSLLPVGIGTKVGTNGRAALWRLS